MKHENLLFSILVVCIAILLLAMMGWAFSFGWVPAVTLEGTTGVTIFVGRALLGVTLLGLVNGVYMLCTLFSFCMREAPTHVE